MRTSISIAVLLAASTTHALANEYRLEPLGGSGQVIVWKSKEAHDEALSLIQAGVHKTNPAMVGALVACMVDGGTKAIVTDMGFVTHDILVVSGESSGCRGNIAAEELGRR